MNCALGTALCQTTSQTDMNANTGSSNWDRRLTIGIESVDSQHQAILTILDKLASLNDNAFTQELISESMSELGTLLSTHFKDEERYIRMCGMPGTDIDAHLVQHSLILEQFVAINMEAMSGKQRNLTELAQIVRSWAVDHVVQYDLKLRQYRSQVAGI